MDQIVVGSDRSWIRDSCCQGGALDQIAVKSGIGVVKKERWIRLQLDQIPAKPDCQLDNIAVGSDFWHLMVPEPQNRA